MVATELGKALAMRGHHVHFISYKQPARLDFFTGTCAWADPKNNLVYVFLSNRVYPSADNKKLVDMNVRTRIMDVIYEAVKVK